MDAHSAELLELPAIVAMVAGSCAFEGGRDLARALAPSPDPAEVARRAETTGEALALLEAGVGGPGEVRDVREEALAAARGATLDGETLDDTRQALRAALELRAALAEHAEAAPGLAALTAGLDHGALSSAADLLERSVGADGQILDGASPELASVRRSLARAQDAARALLRDLARDLADHLQERFTTQRAGRPVLAVRASARKAVPGLVHDRSKSGETLFIEPFALVEANNRSAELAAEERAEVERVLAALSARVGELAGPIGVAIDAMARIDLALGLARVSRSWSGVRVEVGEGVALAGARHPLLERASAVPINMDLSGLRALVVSGPNTGGKTVALKTLGLFALMHQYGLWVPARAARLPVFARVLADIGDEQSIARSLSTFSAHVAAMGRILAAAGPDSLVLLDEVAAGTDPGEGAALAQAVMEALVERGALVVATTHHGELKAWASAGELTANAAVGVDPATYAPTYELRIGAPGASHALAIAARLGLPGAVLQRARDALAPSRRAAEDLLEEAARARAEAEAERARAERERQEAETAREEARGRTAELERRIARSAEQAAKEREAARGEVQAELAGATRELTQLREEIARARREERRRTDDRTGGAERERDRRLGAADEAAERVRAALEGARTGPAGTVGVGDLVIDAVLGLRGRVDAIEGEQAVVIGPSGRMRLPLARLAVDPTAPREPTAPAPPRVEVRVGAQDAGPEVDVRGRRADEAREIARDHVDRAALAGLASVRVIHGHGTGALRAAIREEMARHPLVERILVAPPERGGDGATLVYLDAAAAEE